MWTGVAITLAVIDSFCFAAAAVCQQRAVRRTVRRQLGSDAAAAPALHGRLSHGRMATDPPAWSTVQPNQHRLSLRGMLSLSREPGWLGGVGLMTFGTVLHMVALVLAPVSVVQPIGVLGVPLAVLLAARMARVRPSRATVLPILLCVLSIATFVGLAAGHAGARQEVPFGPLLVLQAGVLLLGGTAVVVARRIHGWQRCVVNAFGGAVGIGMVAVLTRAISQHIEAGPAGVDVGRLLDPVTFGLAALLVVNAILGGWLVQQAYASGPAEVVLAALTVIDPMIAVLTGLVLLGEGSRLPSAIGLAMTLCGIAAVAGVVTLARTHPEVAVAASPGRADADRCPPQNEAPATRPEPEQRERLTQAAGRVW
jgi:uncharacterized membrane protein